MINRPQHLGKEVLRQRREIKTLQSQLADAIQDHKTEADQSWKIRKERDSARDTVIDMLRALGYSCMDAASSQTSVQNAEKIKAENERLKEALLDEDAWDKMADAGGDVPLCDLLPRLKELAGGPEA